MCVLISSYLVLDKHTVAFIKTMFENLLYNMYIYIYSIYKVMKNYISLKASFLNFQMILVCH